MDNDKPSGIPETALVPKDEHMPPEVRTALQFRAKVEQLFKAAPDNIFVDISKDIPGKEFMSAEGRVRLKDGTRYEISSALYPIQDSPDVEERVVVAEYEGVPGKDFHTKPLPLEYAAKFIHMSPDFVPDNDPHTVYLEGHGYVKVALVRQTLPLAKALAIIEEAGETGNFFQFDTMTYRQYLASIKQPAQIASGTPDRDTLLSELITPGAALKAIEDADK